MFNKILIASDLSLASDSVVNCAGGFKQIGAKQVYLCYALGLRYLDVLKYPMIREAEPKLAVQKKILEQQGLETFVEIPSGIPSEEINRLAEDKDLSLIVIGSHGESQAHHLLFKFGGVASEVLHSHQRPLLLVRTKINKNNKGEICVQASCADFRAHVLYATDFSDTSHRAFEYLEEIIKKGCKKVTLLHVQDITRIGKHLEHKLEEFNKIDQERLDMLKNKLNKMRARTVNIKIPYGNPTAEILQELHRNNYSLVVMGSQGRGFIKEVFLGSVSHHIARETATSVLLIPALR